MSNIIQSDGVFLCFGQLGHRDQNGVVALAADITELEITNLIKKLNLNSVANETSTMQQGNTADDAEDGWVQVKDQSIIIHDAKGGGKTPTITPSPEIVLRLNGEIVKSTSEVSSSDRIQWEIDPRPLFEIEVSRDKLQAFLRLHAKQRLAWRLADTEPAQHVTLQVEEIRDVVLETVQLEDITTKAEELKIRANLDMTAIQEELDQPTFRPVLIAKGKSATAGKDAQLEVYFAEQVESRFFEVSGHVDFRNHLHIPNVTSGQIIGRKLPRVDGVPGYDVYGQAIIPPPAQDIMIVTKKGVEMSPSGEIIAQRNGRPRITGEKIKIFDISTSYVVSGDVDIGTGNIVFSGDVIVYGNVTDNMIIESLGNVYVYGSVYNSVITATGSIYVRGNVLGCKLYSGYFGVLFNRLYNASKLLAELMDQVFAAARELLHALERRKQQVQYSQVVLLLVENKFKEIPGILKELLQVVANIQSIKREEYKKLQMMCTVLQQPAVMLEHVTEGFILSLTSLLKETFADVARMQEEKSEIILNQCHNSEIKSNGDIIIQDEGVLLSDLYAARHIIFRDDKSVCRGATLKAGGSIIAKIVGGQTGVSTYLSARKEVRVTKMFSGTVCIGRYCVDIDTVVVNQTYNLQSMKRVEVDKQII